MKKLMSIILILLSAEIHGQGFLKMDTLSELPTELKGIVNGTLNKIFKVDFSGDGVQDFICEVTQEKNNSSDDIEYWITSDLKVTSKKKYLEDYNFFWFINLDNDAEPEIFRANGYEDGIDYAIYDRDPITGEGSLVVYLNPVILENENRYWGHAWDLSDMIVKKENHKIYIRASVDHDIRRDGVVVIPEPPGKFPAIFFYGHSTQPNMKVEEVRNVKRMTLNELK